MSDLAQLRAEATAFLAEIAANPSREGVERLAEIAKRCREQARRDKGHRASYIALAAGLESVSASIVSTLKATAELRARLREK